MSHEHTVSYTRDGFYRPNDPTNSVRALKDDMGRLQFHLAQTTVLQYYNILLLFYAVHTEKHTNNTMTAIMGLMRLNRIETF